MMDEKNYTVVGVNGFRWGSLTQKEAISLARKMQKQMKEAGWSGRMQIYYRDGSAVTWTEETT